MKNTQPVFVVSSGRSGTHALARALTHYPDIDMHHEYCVDYIQPLAFAYYHRLINLDEAVETIRGTYGGAVELSDKRIWGDSSNKLSWLIYPLLKVFPNAKFVWLVRDGRKVVSSFYHKLANECYDDGSVFRMRSWLESPDTYMQPPPEKKYWWPLPPWNPYWELPTRFELLCWHWSEVNHVIGKDIKWVPRGNAFIAKLEDLINVNNDRFGELLNFLGLPWNKDVVDSLKVPDNVHVPVDTSLTDEQEQVFWNECQSTMEEFAYAGETYTVDYHPGGWESWME